MAGTTSLRGLQVVHSRANVGSFARNCPCVFGVLKKELNLASGTAHQITSTQSFSVTDVLSTSNVSSSVCALTNTLRIASLFACWLHHCSFIDVKLQFSCSCNVYEWPDRLNAISIAIGDGWQVSKIKAERGPLEAFTVSPWAAISRCFSWADNLHTTRI